MNKKNKVLLSAVGLVLLSGIAATSSTFAWFTTVRTASINYTEATVTSASGNLVVAYKSSQNTVTGNTVDNVTTITGANSITDISGDGKTFYKPVWAVPTTTASVINTVSTADGFYVDFTVTVSRDNTLAQNGFKVYLGEGTEIVGKTDSANQTLNDSVVPATRLAVLGSDGEVVLRWAPVAETSPEYLVAGTGAYGTTTHQVQADSALKTGAITTETTIAAADAAGYLVADLASGTLASTDLTFRIWIEGEDAQTVNAIIGGVFNVNIALYALEVVA